MPRRGVVTDAGGMTSHAAIVSRTWDSCIVGTNDATARLANGPWCG
jgi:phosphoenolpyruvate synthase/pyruvate phosphate dikinase